MPPLSLSGAPVTTPQPTPQPAAFRAPSPHPPQFRAPTSAPRAQFRSPSQGLPTVGPPSYDDIAVMPDAPAARAGGGGKRFLATFAVLAVMAVIGVAVYRKVPIPWRLRASVAAPAPVVAAPAPPPPSPAEQQAARQRAAEAEIDRLLAGGKEELSALEKHLARWSNDENDPISKAVLSRARSRLAQMTIDELGKEELDGAVAHYRLALSVPGTPAGERRMMLELIRQHAIDALKASDADKSVAWARAGLALGGTEDADAHALLADTLYAAHTYAESVSEYQTALAAKPDDVTIKRGLDRARRKLGSDRAGQAHRSRSGKTKTAAAAGERSAETDSDQAKDEASAPAEAAADEQK
jgi:hypothetical protein